MRAPIRAVCALLVLLAFAPPAHAVPDGDLRTYLEHLEPLALDWPADGAVTDGYGPRWGRMHVGIDIGILNSLDVTAAAAGTVTQSGYLTGYAGYGFSTLYAHLSASDVAYGQWVAAGTRLGTAGCTGSCTGTHLHFELRREGVPIDPAPFLR
jgi:murein DD-endopeptidase MepM/ murein hydrolase activator NlpD